MSHANPVNDNGSSAGWLAATNTSVSVSNYPAGVDKMRRSVEWPAGGGNMRSASPYQNKGPGGVPHADAMQ